ncbi:MAG: transketolase, partial [bacterium]|nr:transketolase [bacterium]
MTTTAGLENLAERIRNRVFEHVLKNNGGYLSQALSAAGIFAALYGSVLKLGPVEGPLVPGEFPGVPSNSNRAYNSGGRFNGAPGPDRDRFLFSPAHYALVLYAALIEAGRLDPSALDQFNADGSTMEMIGAEHSPGVETTTGSLAQALSQGAGIALARQMRGESGRTWVFMS